MPKCAAKDCTFFVPHQVLMCRAHWDLIPTELRNRIYRGWAESRAQGVMTEEYRKARTDAIEKAGVAKVHDSRRDLLADHDQFEPRRDA